MYCTMLFKFACMRVWFVLVPVVEFLQLSYMCAAGSDLRSCRFIAFLCSVIRVSIFFLCLTYMYRCGQSQQGIMWMAFFVLVVMFCLLCFVKYDLSLCVGLCATLILNGRNSLSVISDVLFMYGKIIVVFGCLGCALDLLICMSLVAYVGYTLLMKFFWYSYSS